MSVTPIGIKAEGLEFVKAVWEQQPGGYFVLKFRSLEGEWISKWYHATDSSVWPLHRLTDTILPIKADMYFSPVAYNRCRAMKEYVLPSRWLFADLDYLKPTDAPIAPDVSWETSPGKWQAMWYLEHLVEPEEFKHLNRAMCHACGADPGTWNTNRLLRVPGTANMKRYRRAA